MDTVNKLHQLQNEILSFGNVVKQTKDSSDIDFCNACNLFSQYLNCQLKSISANLCMKDIRPEMQQTTAQLYQLNELITPDITENNDKFKWHNKLLSFCNQLQSLKCIAA